MMKAVRVTKEEGKALIVDLPIAPNSVDACRLTASLTGEVKSCNRQRNHEGLHASHAGAYGNQQDSWVTSYWVRGD